MEKHDEEDTRSEGACRGEVRAGGETWGGICELALPPERIKFVFAAPSDGVT